MMMDADTALEMALEHAAVKNALRDIREEYRRLLNESGSDLHVGKLSGMLLMFGHHLRRHFALEERSGFLGGGGSPSKEDRAAIEHLLHQHRTLEQQLTALVDSVERAHEARASLSEAFVEGLDRFLAELDGHEEEETALVQRLAVHQSFSKD